MEGMTISIPPTRPIIPTNPDGASPGQSAEPTGQSISVVSGQPIQAESPTPADVAPGITVALSDRNETANALLQGAVSVETEELPTLLEALKTEVGEGFYRRDSRKVATALLSFEKPLAERITR